MFPRAGSEHEFARQVFPRWVSFTAGWAMTLALIVAAATVSLGFARYVQVFFDVNVKWTAFALLVFVALVAASGMKRASWLIFGLSFVQVGGLILVVVLSVDHVGDVDLFAGNGLSGVLAGSALIFFAFIGFDEIITLSEETKDASRTIPRALLLSLSISTILYVLVAVVSVSVLGSQRLANSKQPLTDVVLDAFGSGAGNIVSVIALITTMNTTLLVVIAASRMAYGMASHGDLPKVFARLHNRFAPRNAIAAAFALAALLLLVGDIHQLAAATDALVYLMFVLVNVIVIVLRVRKPDVVRVFRVPLTIGLVPVLPVLGIAVTILMSSQLERSSVVLATGLTLLGTTLFFVVSMVHGKQRAKQK